MAVLDLNASTFDLQLGRHDTVRCVTGARDEGAQCDAGCKQFSESASVSLIYFPLEALAFKC